MHWASITGPGVCWDNGVNWKAGVYIAAPPALAGDFYDWNHPNKPPDLPPMPGSIANKTATDFTHPVARSIHKKCKAKQIKPPHYLALKQLISPQRNCQILRPLSPLRMTFESLNLTATWCHSSGIWLSQHERNRQCCCPGDSRFLLLLRRPLASTNRFSILEPQWHLAWFLWSEGDPFSRAVHIPGASLQAWCQFQETGVPVPNTNQTNASALAVIL